MLDFQNGIFDFGALHITPETKLQDLDLQKVSYEKHELDKCVSLMFDNYLFDVDNTLYVLITLSFRDDGKIRSFRIAPWVSADEVKRYCSQKITAKLRNICGCLLESQLGISPVANSDTQDCSINYQLSWGYGGFLSCYDTFVGKNVDNCISFNYNKEKKA